MSEMGEVDRAMAEASRQAMVVVATMIQAASQLAQALIRLRAEQLRRAAEAGQRQAAQARAQVRAWQKADAVVWQAVHREGWWRHAGAEDISRAWRAAATWASVDPRAEEARNVMREHLADRGVDLADTDVQAHPEDARWLSDALDRAAALDEIRSGAAFDGVVDQLAQPESGRPEDGEQVPVGPVEAARDTARGWLAQYGEQIGQRQAERFPEDRPNDPIWQAFADARQRVVAASEQLGEAGNVPAALRDAASTVGGRMGGRLWQLADRMDPSGQQLSPEVAERWQAQQRQRQDRQTQAVNRQEQMAAHVRAAWPPERAERVMADEAWPVLAGLLARLDADGRDVRELLDAVPQFVDRARSPAAYAFRVIDDPMRQTAEARQRIASRAVAARLDQREQETAEDHWREEPGPAGQERAGEHHATAEGDADRAVSAEEQAAALAAQGYPGATREVVAAAAKSGKPPATQPGQRSSRAHPPAARGEHGR